MLDPQFSHIVAPSPRNLTSLTPIQVRNPRNRHVGMSEKLHEKTKSAQFCRLINVDLDELEFISSFCSPRQVCHCSEYCAVSMQHGKW